MELDTLFGLPAHPLIVHAVVVLVPLAAVGGIAIAVSGWVRAHIGWLVVAFALLSVVLIPLATGSGEALEKDTEESALLEKHTEMGEQLLPWVVALAVGTLVVMLLARAVSRLPDGSAPPAWASRGVVIAIAVLTVVAATGTLVQVARIGHSGAKATWTEDAG